MIQHRVSDHVLQALRRTQQTHPVVLWLDAPGEFTALVAQHAEDADPIIGYTGSYLAMLRATAFLDAERTARRLVVHVPGVADVDALRPTPLCALVKYAETTTFSRSLPVMIREAAAGLIEPSEVEAFLQEGPDLARADAWMASRLGGVQAALEQAVMHKTLTQLLDDLLSGEGLFADDGDAQDVRNAVLNGVVLHTGLPLDWPAQMGFGLTTRAEIAAGAAAWALCVEYVADLSRAPKDDRLLVCGELSETVVTACSDLAQHLRARPAVYRRVALTVEHALKVEREDATPDVLGRIDTFRFEEEAFLKGALAALDAQEWTKAEGWASDRADGSFWVEDDATRDAAWQLIGASARLGKRIQTATDSRPARHASLDAAIDDYAMRCAPVDRAHRALEQRRVSPLFGQLPHFEGIHATLEALRREWADWAQAEAVMFTRVCAEQGYLPTRSRQQRHLFEQIVAPLVGDGRVAFLLVDALRYEMAVELAEHLDGDVDVQAWAAELPTITSVGMNVLGPVVRQGKLHPIWGKKDIEGFHAGVFGVRRLENRQKVLREAAGGGKCPEISLADAQRLSVQQLRRKIQGARLSMVHSTLFDDAGEKSVGPEAFAALLQGLRIACQRLRDAGIERLVITADHGFLLRRGVMDDRVRFGGKTDGNRRHAWGRSADGGLNRQTVPARDLGYFDDGDRVLVMPEGIQVFDQGKKPSGFVHGGNSPQERIVPVMVVRYIDSKRPQTKTFTATLERDDQKLAAAGAQAVRITVHAVHGALAFAESGAIAVALVVPDQPDVQLTVVDVRNGVLDGSMIMAPVGEACTVLFELVGPTDSRARLAIARPDAPDHFHFEPSTEWFSVRGRPRRRSEAPQAVAPEPGLSWLDAMDPQARIVYEHLSRHDGVGEADVIRMLGGTRAARRFARRIEEYNRLAPFVVRLESANNIKRYVRAREVTE